MPDDTGPPAAAMPAQPRRDRVARAPVAIEVRDLEKTFHIADHRVDTLKERVVRPLARHPRRELRALRPVSFDVHRGEFFGIVGRNGSGKSTLLKLLSSIYRADAGTIRLAGRLAPFIELGVGFDPELTARENVALSGVLMGLGRRHAARRLDAVLDFAELRHAVDLKLKNYSSGMMVRLAFAAMVEADADVMLIDEVLAVGDAAFARKCMDVFREKRAQGKTLVLVTHDMATVQSFCDRALLLHDGEPLHLGDPEEVALRYYRLNFGGATGAGAATGGGVPDVNVRLVEAELRDEQGVRVDNVEQGRPVGVSVLLEALHDLDRPVFQVHVVNPDGVWVVGFSQVVADASSAPARVAAGQRVRIAGTFENPLVPGRYTLDCWISRTREEGDMALHVLRLVDFVVYGVRPGAGDVSVDAQVDIELEPVAGAPPAPSAAAR